MATTSRRPPNTALAALLEEARWSPANLAREVNELGKKTGRPLNYDASAVCHWVTGTTPRRHVRPLICEAFARRLGRPITLANVGLGPEQTHPKPGMDIVAGLVDLGSADMDPSRRSVLGAGLYSAALAIPGWEDVSARFERLRRDPHTRIGQREVDAVKTMTDHLSTLDDQFGGRMARPLAAAFAVNTLAPYLRARATPSVQAAMLSAAADHCYLTGYMASDEGLDGVAQSYFVKALELSGQAGDHLTYCTTLRGMSVQAASLGQGDNALSLAEASAEGLPQSGPRMRAFLIGQQAHAAAMTGDHVKARQKMREAQTSLERAESQTRAFGSYDPAALHYHLSQVLYEGGDLKGSIKAMQQSNRLRPPVYRRIRIRNLGILAERKLQAGRLEEACRDWHRMLEDFASVQSGWCDDRYRTMVAAVAPHRHNRHVRELLEHARTVKPVAR